MQQESNVVVPDILEVLGTVLAKVARATDLTEVNTAAGIASQELAGVTDEPYPD